jgi:hypothetical protein
VNPEPPQAHVSLDPTNNESNEQLSDMESDNESSSSSSSSSTTINENQGQVERLWSSNSESDSNDVIPADANHEI